VTDVGCAGLLVEDTFCGPMERLPPEGSVSVLHDMPVRAGGCAANVAIDLAKQGVATEVVGCVGSDGGADLLAKTLSAHGVGSEMISRVASYPTSKTVILLIDGQDRRYLHVPGANRAFTTDHIPRDWVSRLKVFYLGGLFALPGIDLKGFLDLLKFCRSSKVLTVVDVVVPHSLSGMDQLAPLLPHIDVFLPNEDEARAFTGVAAPLEQLECFKRAGANTVIVTRGGQGSVAMEAGRIWRCGSYQMKVIDPSGSGDAFTSGVIRGLLQGWELPKTLRYASAVGASATRAAGTTDSVFSAPEAEAFIKDHSLAVTEGIERWM
jgi:sugar/nucleoside kinase (ribokinase family)